MHSVLRASSFAFAAALSFAAIGCIEGDVSEDLRTTADALSESDENALANEAASQPGSEGQARETARSSQQRGEPSTMNEGSAPEEIEPSDTSNERCGGEYLPMKLGSTLKVIDSLAEAHDDHVAICASGVSAPDQVYSFDVPQGGATATVDLKGIGASWMSAVLSLRTECDVEESFESCTVSEGAAQLRRHLQPGTHFVVVEAASGQPGAYQLDIQLAKPTCGDGVINANEACDPGAPSQQDGCGDPAAWNACQVEIDALTGEGSEEL